MKKTNWNKWLKTILLVCLLIVGISAVTASAASMKISKSTAKLYKGQTLTLSVKGLQPGDKVKWKSSKKSVAAVTQAGKVTAKKAGKATISAKVGKVTLKCKVTVKNPTISLNKKKSALYVGDAQTLQATVKGKSQKVTWKSSNKLVATVDSSGKVKAKKKGTATITAKANGVKVTCKITVKKVYTQKQAEKGLSNYLKKQASQNYYYVYEGKIGDEYAFMVHYRPGAKIVYYIHQKTGQMYESGPYFSYPEWKLTDPKIKVGKLSKYL